MVLLNDLIDTSSGPSISNNYEQSIKIIYRFRTFNGYWDFSHVVTYTIQVEGGQITSSCLL